jgi:hypothetical protein
MPQNMNIKQMSPPLSLVAKRKEENKFPAKPIKDLKEMRQD